MISFVITSCSKDGADGAPGPAGLVGAQGPAGADGNDGTSNMSSSNITSNTWYWDSGMASFLSIHSNTAVTQQVIDSGAVMVYINNYYASPVALPFTLLQGPDFTEQFSFTFSLNQVTLMVQNSDFDQSFVPWGGWEFRVVVITPAMLAAKPGTDWNNYGEVEKLLNQ